MNATLNAARAALQPLGVPIFLGMFLATDSDGMLILPEDETFIVLHGITSIPYFEWRNYSFDERRIQVNAFSKVEGTANALLNQAKPLLTAARFTPGISNDLGRDGDYTGASQDWEVNT